MAVRSGRVLYRTPQQLAQFQKQLDEMMIEMCTFMWLEEIAWRMYGIGVEQYHDEVVVTIPEGNSHGKKT